MRVNEGACFSRQVGLMDKDCVFQYILVSRY